MAGASSALVRPESAPQQTSRTITPQRRRFAQFAWVTLSYTLFVIMWGAFVRATGSGAGCGSHWPLCNGQIVPHSPAIGTLIEYGHRLTSGVALLLVFGLAIGARRLFPQHHTVRLGAFLSALFIVTEALIGAGLVLLEHVADDPSIARGFWVAGHLLNTFFLVAALALTAWWASGHAAPTLRGQGVLAVTLMLALTGVLLISVSGAVTALGDTLFPVTSLAEAKVQTFSQTAHAFVRLRIWHPALAIVVAAFVLLSVVQAVTLRSDRTVRRLGAAAIGVYLVQLAVGAANVWFLAPVPLQLVHLLLSDLIWILLVLLAARALSMDQQKGRRTTAAMAVDAHSESLRAASTERST